MSDSVWNIPGYYPAEEDEQDLPGTPSRANSSLRRGAQAGSFAPPSHPWEPTFDAHGQERSTRPQRYNEMTFQQTPRYVPPQARSEVHRPSHHPPPEEWGPTPWNQDGRVTRRNQPQAPPPVIQPPIGTGRPRPRTQNEPRIGTGWPQEQRNHRNSPSHIRSSSDLARLLEEFDQARTSAQVRPQPQSPRQASPNDLPRSSIGALLASADYLLMPQRTQFPDRLSGATLLENDRRSSTLFSQSPATTTYSITSEQPLLQDEQDEAFVFGSSTPEIEPSLVTCVDSGTQTDPVILEDAELPALALTTNALLQNESIGPSQHPSQGQAEHDDEMDEVEAAVAALQEEIRQVIELTSGAMEVLERRVLVLAEWMEEVVEGEDEASQ